jgi:hypothetical protein
MGRYDPLLIIPVKGKKIFLFFFFIGKTKERKILLHLAPSAPYLSGWWRGV